jgi:hypothetical protein
VYHILVGVYVRSMSFFLSRRSERPFQLLPMNGQRMWEMFNNVGERNGKPYYFVMTILGKRCHHLCVKSLVV